MSLANRFKTTERPTTLPGDGRSTILLPLLISLLAFVLPTASQAQFGYTIDNGEVTITGYTGSDENVTIPHTLESFPVTGIGDEAFAFMSVTNVVMPDSVRSVGNYAFRSASVRSVGFSSNVTTLGEGAFFECLALTGITLGNALTSIGDYTFKECAGLTNVIIPTSVIHIGTYAFHACRGLIDVTIPDSVATISYGAFSECTGTLALAINDGVISIADYAFHDCSQITRLTLPASIRSIGETTFSECRSLTNLLFSNGVTNIGNLAFYNCSSLTHVTLPESVASMGREVFLGCGNLEHIAVDPDNPYFGAWDGVLYNRARTTLIWYPPAKVGSSYTIPKSANLIGDSAFASCINLLRLYFEGQAPQLGEGPFYDTRFIIFYLPGTSGWNSPFGGATAVLWNPRILTGDGNLAVQVGQFGFTIEGAADIPVAVEACDDLANPDWSTIANLTCNAEGMAQFTDPEAATKPTRSYRFRAE